MTHKYISISKIVSSYFYVQVFLVHPCLSEMNTLSDVCPNLLVALQRHTEQWHSSSSKDLRDVSSLIIALWDDMGLRKMEFLSLNLFNALKICLSGLSGILQEL